MTERKQQILSIIINEHIDTAMPVGSASLVQKYNLNFSPATIRNEMASLEHEGYIIQPHTSAGRIPTEKAYLHYLEHLTPKTIDIKDSQILDIALAADPGSSYRNTAKALASLSNSAIFWAFHKRDLFYTGISNLFSQPEFKNSELIYDVSAVIDKMDEVIDQIFDEIDEGTTIRIGSTNSFSTQCGSIIYKYKHGNQTGMFGILAPMRMNYALNISLLNYVANNL